MNAIARQATKVEPPKNSFL